MNKTKVAKAVAKNLTNFAVSSATTSVIRKNVRPTSNPILNLAIDISVIAGGWFVSGTIMEPVNEHIDREIDKLSASLTEFTK
jgi:hypothetical protein